MTTDSMIFEEVIETPTPEQTPPVNLDNTFIEPNEQPKKKRGRPRKDESQNATKPQANKAQTNTGTNSSIFEDIRSQVNQNQQDLDRFKIAEQPEIPVQSQPMLALLDGYMLLAFIDAVCPGIIKFIFKKKFEKINIDKIMLTESQKTSLEPLADEMAKQVAGQISPMTAFAIAIGSMYYQNALKALK